MKKTTIILISAILSVHSITVAQDTEIQPYEVIKAIDSVEIRFYPSATLVQTSGGNNFDYFVGLYFGVLCHSYRMNTQYS